MKVKNAQELSIFLNIDLDHLQLVWKSFLQNEGYPENIVFSCLENQLTQDEKYYLMYLGLANISDAVLNSLIGKNMKKENDEQYST